MAGADESDHRNGGTNDWPTLAGRLAALGSIAGEAAHRFNNLRAVIEGTIELLPAEPVGSHVLPRLERIMEAAAGARALAVALVGIARSESPGETLLDLGAWLLAARPWLTVLLRPDNRLTIEVPPAPVRLFSNPDQLRAALTALVLNAAAALGPTGQLGIRLEVDQPEQAVLLTVTDNGAGMAPGVAARAREPFFTTRPPAAGLGLTVAEAFAHRYRGRLDLSSNPGEGTRVSLWLPATALSPAP